jgi:hypothetical protein
MVTEIEHVVGQLRRVGLRPSDRQWEMLREAGVAAVEPVLALALDADTLGQAEPASLGPVHALRLLGELPPPQPEAIERLLCTRPPDAYRASQAAYIWWQELPQIVARLGRPGYEAACRVLLDQNAGTEQRAVATESLSYMVELDGTLREAVTTLLREQLTAETDPYVMAHVVEALSNLGAASAYVEVMGAYKRGAVDREIFSAADARQRLLNPKASRALECVHHSLAERYEKHGPYTEEQRRAMAEHYRASH